ncbi:MAG: putative O-glycosylation ligase, exosortase A system-associated [Bryobacteraceae bacterium]
MREAILVLVVLALAALAVFRPVFGLYAYVWFALMRPDFYAWAQGSFPFSPVLAGATLLGSIPKLVNLKAIFKDFSSLLLLAYQVPIAASVVFSVAPYLTYYPYAEFERITLMALLIPVLIQTERDLRGLFLVIALSQGMVALKFGLFGLRSGGVHITDGYAGLDNNGLALAVVMVLPFCWYMRQKVDSLWLKALLVAMVFSAITAVIMTESRNGALALVTVLLMIAWRSRYKVPVLLMFALLAVPAFLLFQKQFVARMSTLENASADSSAYSRWILSQTAFRMWQDYPVFGVGFGNEVFILLQPPYIPEKYQATMAQDLKVHNTYLQILVDSGIFALAIFVVLLFSTIFRLGTSSRYWKKAKNPALRVYPMALQCSLVAIAQYGIAGGRERYDFLYILLMSAAAWFLLERKLRADTQSPQPVGASPVPSSIPLHPWAQRPSPVGNPAVFPARLLG